MLAVRDLDRRLLDGGVAGEVGADQPAVPGPAVLGVGRGVDARVAATLADVILERRLLGASSGSPVVERKTTASYRARVSAVNTVEFSLQSTAIPSRPAARQIASRPAGIESCRKPVVSENTSTRPTFAFSQSRPTAGTSTVWACADAGNASASSVSAQDSSSLL